MSETPAPLSSAHFEYIAAHTLADDDFLVRLKAAALEAGLPQIAIGAAQGSFLQVLTRLSGARELVEVGTLAGYSALRMARALPDGGRVRTIELSGKHADFAEQWIARSDVPDRVEVHRGAGLDVLATFADGSADGAFVDADKESYGAYLEECLRIVRVGGWIAVDNALAFGCLLDPGERSPSVEAVRAFNERIAGEARLQAVLVPIGDGCWVGVRNS